MLGIWLVLEMYCDAVQSDKRQIYVEIFQVHITDYYYVPFCCTGISKLRLRNLKFSLRLEFIRIRFDDKLEKTAK